MTKGIDEELIGAIRRSDAFTNAATALIDAEEERGGSEGYSQFWEDIRHHVIPTLEAEAHKATEDVAWLRTLLTK